MSNMIGQIRQFLGSLDRIFIGFSIVFIISMIISVFITLQKAELKNIIIGSIYNLLCLIRIWYSRKLCMRTKGELIDCIKKFEFINLLFRLFYVIIRLYRYFLLNTFLVLLGCIFMLTVSDLKATDFVLVGSIIAIYIICFLLVVVKNPLL